MSESNKKKSDLKIFPSGDQDVVVTRTFNAPAEFVFAALTKPELIKRWLLGPDGWTMPFCEVDLRVGGKYRYVWKNDDGREMGMGGVYREIASPHRLVHTELFDEAWYPGECLITTVLTEKDGKTLFTGTMHYVSKEARESTLTSGMEDGLIPSYDRLEAIVEELKRG